MKQIKSELRKKYLDIRKSNEKDLLKRSEEIIKNLKTLDELKIAQTVMIYVSYRGEVETHGLIRSLLKDKKTVCVPLCDGEDTMTARGIKSFADLKPGKFGILEPDFKAEEISPEKIDFVVVPGCVFSRSGHRIGYGRGYYDRFLSNTKATKCGIGYGFSLLDDIPFEKTDIRLDIIVTEKEVIKP